MSRFDSKIGVRRDELGAMVEDLNLRLTPLEEGARNEEAPGTDIPTVDTSFVPVYDRSDKKWVYVTLRFNIPGNTYDLNIIIVERALAVDEASYDQKRLKGGLANAIEDDHRAAAPPTVTDRIDIKLKYSTVYDIIRLIAKDKDGTPTANPQNTNFAPIPVVEPLGYPGNVLFSFTTPDRFGAPPFPVLADIDTQLDFETDGYDAYAIILNIAPLHPETGAVQTYRQAGVTWVQNVLSRDFSGATGTQEIPEKYLLTETDLDAVMGPGPFAGRGFCRVKFTGLVPGGNYTLVKVMVHTVDGNRTTTGSVAFVAGSIVRNLAGLSNTALVATNTDPFDGGDWVNLALEFTQPWPSPNSLRHITQDYKRSTVTDWTQVGDEKNEVVQSDIYHRQVNAGVISIGIGSVNLTGVGTQMTRWAAGWKIKVGVQTFVIAVKPTSDTAATITLAAGSAVVSSPYTVVMVLPLLPIKVKPSRTYNNSLRIVGRGNTSLTLTLDVVIGADGHVINDTGVPVFSVTPILKPKVGKLQLVASIDVELGATNTITVRDRWELSINDGTNSLNIGDPSSEAIVSGIAFYGVEGPRVKIPADRDHLIRIFGISANLRCKFAATNDFGRTESSNSVNMALSGLTDVTTLYSPINKVKNGHFHNSDGTIADHWEDYDPRSGTFGNVDQSGKLRADLAAHRGKWRDTTTQENQRFLVQNRGKRWRRGEWFSCVWNMYSNGTPTIDEMVIGLFTQKTLANNISGTGTSTTGTGFLNDGGADTSTGVHVGSIIGNGSEWRTVTVVTDTVLTMDRAWTTPFGPVAGVALILQSDRLRQTNLALTTADKFQKGKIMTLTNLDVSRDIYFVVLLRDIVDTTTFPFIDAICINPGQESAGYQESVEEFELGNGGTENFDTAPSQGSSSIGGQPPGATSGPQGTVLEVQY